MKQKIIDSHAHLGDLLYGQSIIFKQNVKERDYHDLLVEMEYNDMTLPKDYADMPEDEVAERIRIEERVRNGMATLQHMQKTLEENQVESIWMLPVIPNVSFEDVLAASLLDNRVIPFTGIDFALGDGASKKLMADVQKGARGLKIHPILQRQRMLGDQVIDCLKAWEDTGMPVIFHAYPYAYFHPEEAYRNNPEFGSNADLITLAKMFPDINFISAHGGGMFTYEELYPAADLENVYTDTSFQPAEIIRGFIKRFGPKRVLFGSDWPWGIQEPIINIVRNACDGDQELENRIFYQNAVDILK